MSDSRHFTVSANGIRIHCAESGPQDGPLVILVHGFPESWYSWRYQLPALAAAGYRAVAIDVRGYGRTSAPVEVDAYRMLALVGDVVSLVGALGAERATLIGHDWGAPIVWNSALLRPDLFRGVAGLSVPYSPRGDVAPLDAFRMVAGAEHEFYVEYFQQPGRAEAEIEPDVRQWIYGFYYCASGEPKHQPNVALIPRGTQMKDMFIYPDTHPEWMTEQDLDFYASEFERTGLTGGLNRYRNVGRDFNDLAAYRDQPINIPALFIGGERDGPTIWGAASIERFPETLPKLSRSVIVPGSGHWIQQERWQETNDALLEFLAELH
ncbi:MAG: alpha/beta hydrolase [Pseudomonadota bacterium]